MMIEIAELALILLLLVLSFAFSGTEVALFSLSEVDRLKLARDKNHSRKNFLITQYLNHPQKALITILFGNMLVNLSASIIGEQLTNSIFPKNPLFFSVFIMTFCIVLFGEILPKNIAAHRQVRIAKTFIGVIDAVYKIFYPVIYLLAKTFGRRGSAQSGTALTKDELVSAIEAAKEAGVDATTIDILKNMFELLDRPVTDIMVPRAQVAATDIEGKWKSIESFMKETSHADVVFYAKNIDRIIGYASKIDLIDAKKKDLESLVRAPIYIPESKTILALLNDFKNRNSHIAIILDEFGGTVGLVTLKDVLDSIFARDLILRRQIKEKGEGLWSVAGETRIYDVNKLFNLTLPDDTHTISGYLTNMSGSIPVSGDRYSFIEGYEITVLRTDNRQIELMEFRKIS